ncbi:hypothetical protein [Kitasatospora sp. NPDC048407]|uniref:hypothetical protein n=1 Tax=Kitasatospora sp. NPDC048407 TaxID=3364051 RepID=UPI003718ECFB
MQPIVLDGITSSAVQSVQRPARLGASWHVAARPQLLDDFAFGSLPPTTTDRTVEPVEQPFQRRIGRKRVARLVEQFRRVENFVVPDGMLRLTAIDDLVLIDGQHRLAAVQRGEPHLSFLEALPVASMVSHGVDVEQTKYSQRRGSTADVVWPDGLVVQAKLQSALSRLESGYWLALALASATTWSTTPAPVVSFIRDVEPLAVACGITRLSRPLVPRAPGPICAAGRFGVGDHGLNLSLAA